MDWKGAALSVAAKVGKCIQEANMGVTMVIESLQRHLYKPCGLRYKRDYK